MAEPSATITTGVARHPAVAAWRDVCGSRVLPECVQVVAERASSAIYRLVGVGPRRSDVIAKRCPSAVGALERTIYQDVIRHLPVTAPRFYGSKPDDGGCWLLLEDVGARRYSASNEAHRALAGRWLGRMHTEAARCPAASGAARQLPDGGPGRYLEHLRAACEAVERNLSNPALRPADVALLTRVVAGHRQLATRWDGWVAVACAGIPATLVHGDFRPKNAYVREDARGTQLFPIDWEMAGWGIPAADLTRVDLRAYSAVVRERWPDVDLDAVERVAAFGQIFRLLAAIGWETTNLAFSAPELLIRPLEGIRVLAGQLDDAIRAAERRSVPPAPPAGAEDPRASELRDAVRAAYEGVDGGVELLGYRRLKSRVHRVQVSLGGGVRSLVVKRLDPRAAEVNRLVVQRWLPAIGLADCTPRLLAVAGDRHGRWVWHVYEDLGDSTLRGSEDRDPRRVEAAVELVARLHTRAAVHPVLAECRHHAGDLGIHYFTANLRDAIRGLEALRDLRSAPAADVGAVRDRLLGRLYALREEQPRRAQALERHGGPETLLHGDLWTSNTLVSPSGTPPQARLIDWDHAGVGPTSYDLSTLLYRFRAEDRPWVLDCYARAGARAGWQLPPADELNLLFETAECARYANRVIWPAVALLENGADWAVAELAEILGWFDRLEPVLAG
jgi:aminoglycoside phosphotransferase (APT) family kinase protein